MNFLRIQFSFLALLLAFPVFGDEGFEVVKDLSFSSEVPDLKLSLYLPKRKQESVDSKLPCVLAISGGGFAAQSGKRFAVNAQYLATRGFAAALVAYRGRPDHTYQQTLADLDAALAYVRKHAHKYDIDPNRIGAMGRSAGGTLAALLAVMDRDNEPIQAAVCFAGVFDFVGRFTKQEQIDLQPRLELKRKTNGEWIGADFAKDDKQWMDASALTHVDSSDPPILFLHSKNDAVVPWPQSRDMFDAIRKHSRHSELRLFQDGGHGVRPKDADPMKEMVLFFRKHLSAKTAGD